MGNPERQRKSARKKITTTLALAAAISLTQGSIQDAALSVRPAHAAEDGEAAYAPFITLTPFNAEEILKQNSDKNIIIMFTGPACSPCKAIAREMAKIQSNKHLFLLVITGDERYEKGDFAEVADQFAELLGSPRGMPNGTPFLTVLIFDRKTQKWDSSAIRPVGRFNKSQPAEHWMKAIRKYAR